MIPIHPPFVLAPMAGYTDKIFRTIMKRFGCGLVYTEMVSAAGLAYHDKKTPHLMEIDPEEHPVAIQLFGNKPEDLARAVPIAEAAGADMIDLNFGCPVPKVSKQGAGAALMKQPELLQSLIRATVRAATKPVSVKFRSGWDMQSINVVECSRMAEAEGVSLISVHPRTRSQAFTGQADWSVIAAVKAAVKIPVIGSGDITSRDQALARMQETGCDAVMIGRGAVQFFIPEDQRVSVLWEHVQKFAEWKGERYLPEMRKFVTMYTKGMPGASQMRQAANTAKTLEEFRMAVFL